MKIGIDLDNVVFDSATVILDELRSHTDVEIKEIGSYWIEEAFDIDKHLVDKAVRKTISASHLPILTGVDRVLNWLQDICPPLYFISDRPVKHYHSTWNQLRNINLEKNLIILTDKIREEKPLNKIYLTNMLDIDIFIEDRPDTINDLYLKTKCDILVFDRPWNKDIYETDRIFIMKNWIEIRDFLMRRIQDV